MLQPRFRDGHPAATRTLARRKHPQSHGHLLAAQFRGQAKIKAAAIMQCKVGSVEAAGTLGNMPSNQPLPPVCPAMHASGCDFDH